MPAIPNSQFMDLSNKKRVATTMAKVIELLLKKECIPVLQFL